MCFIQILKEKMKKKKKKKKKVAYDISMVWV